jgi:hypothetical protein
MKKLVNLLIGFLLLAPAALAAETSSEIDADRIFAEKKAAIKETIPLTEEQGEFFWRLYDQYEKKEMEIYKRRADHIREYMQNYKNMSDEKAEWLMNDYIQIEADAIDLKRKLVKKFGEKLPSKTVMQFFVFQELLEAGFISHVAEKWPEIK